MVLVDRLRALRLVPVIVIDDPADAAPLADALVEGGLPCAEVTFRTAGAADALARMAEARPELLLGAGTVLTPEQAGEARQAGAHFVVSPGFSPEVVDRCLADGTPIFPGVCTPTEIEMALRRGLGVLKFFPAEATGGVPFLRAISAPYGGVEFIPTGGITLENVGKYLALPSVVACGGSWLARREWIRERHFDRIRDEVARSVRVVQAPIAAGGLV